MTFSEYLQTKNLSNSTIKRYEIETEYYKTYLKKRAKNGETATKKDILDYLKKLDTERQITAKTKQSILGILKHYHGYLSQTHSIQNPTQLIKIRGAKRKHLRHLLTAEEMEQLSDVFYSEMEKQFSPSGGNAKGGLKEYLLLTFAIYQGFTATEINQLTAQDIDLRKATIKIQRAKRSNGRTIALEAPQIGSLIQYLNTGKTDFKTSNNQFKALFIQLRGILPKFEDFMQIRSSVITNWIKIHGLRKAQYLAGHRYISSTENYLANDFESLQNDLENFHPLR